MGHGVKVLLDTCTLLWLTQEPEKLSNTCMGVINEPSTILLLSHASVWEIVLKIQSGKFNFPMPLRKWLDEQKSVWAFEYLPINLEHLLRTGEIEKHHLDPFDRLLVVQAMTENIGILTPDEFIAKYPVHSIW